MILILVLGLRGVRGIVGGALFENGANNEVDDGEGEGTDDKADGSVENGVFGFFDLG